MFTNHFNKLLPRKYSKSPNKHIIFQNKRILKSFWCIVFLNSTFSKSNKRLIIIKILGFATMKTNKRLIIVHFFPMNNH